jgi:glycosidase
MRKSIAILALFLLVQGAGSIQVFAQKKKKNKSQIHKPNTMPTKKTDKLVICQVMFHLWGNTNTTNKINGTAAENGVTKFSDFNETSLKALKDFGYTHLYMTGILEHSTTEDYTPIGIKKDNPINVKGRCGAPFAVKDYFDTNPFYANDPTKRIEEFEAMVKRIHKAGLKIVMDIVPNHLAREYGSDKKPKGVQDFGEGDDNTVAFSAKNNFYYLPNKTYIPPTGGNEGLAVAGSYIEKPAKVTGNDVFSESPSKDDWFETVKLNYGVDYVNSRTKHFSPVPSTWTKMVQVFDYWAAKGVDGFRCDMAEMVPVEFWQYGIAEAKKKHPNLVYIAEIYNPKEYHNYVKIGGFDYLYDKVGLYDALRRLMENRPEGTAEDITKVWQNESGDISQNMLRFLENHDEQRVASRFFANDPFKAIPSMVLSATLHTGPLMIYFGQELGEKAEGSEGFGSDDGRTTMFDFHSVPTHTQWLNGGKCDGGLLNDSQKKLRGFYADLLKLVNGSDAIKNGHFYDLQYAQNYDKRKIYSYLRHTDKQKLLIVCNFDLDNSKNFRLSVPAHALEQIGMKGQREVVLKDIFHDKRQTSLSETEGVQLEMKPNSVLIFEIKPLTK